MFRFVLTLFVPFLTAACVAATPISLEEADFADPSTLVRTGEFCAAATQVDTDKYTRLCSGAFSCTDGGCIPDVIFAIVDANREDQFLTFISRPYVTGQQRRLDLEGMDRKELVEWPWFPDQRTLTEDLVIYEVNTQPGFDVGLILELRQRQDIVFDAMRFGRPAGLPPFSLQISAEQFFLFRGAGATQLRPFVRDAFEGYLGTDCSSVGSTICNIVASQGQVKVNLLTPGTSLTGRPDFWEKSEWYVYPTQTFAGYYDLKIDVPITSIRRWPTDGLPPNGGFTSVDHDPGFELLRQEIASSFLDALEASIPPWSQ